MNIPHIPKELLNYINSNVFINNLNIPSFNTQDFDIKILEEISLKLDILMKIPHQEFWCHIIFDKNILNSLQSFCNNSKRPYELKLEEENLQKIECELYKKYFLLFVRLITRKEVNLSEFSNSNFGALIYDNFIIDIPLLFDLCSLYGEKNPELIGKMISTVFSCQSLYKTDFKQYALESVKLLTEKIDSTGSKEESPKNRSKLNLNLLKKSQSTEKLTIELLFYIIDFSYSWYMMLNSVKSNIDLIDILFDISFHKSVEKLFDKIVPIIQLQIDKFETTDPEKMKRLLSVSCFYLVNVWRTIIDSRFLSKLNENRGSIRSSEENFSLITECVTVLSGCQERPIFADAENLMFPIQDDFQAIFQAVTQDKDEYYSDFVHESVEQIMKDINSRQTIFSIAGLIENELNPSIMINKSEPESEDSSFANVREIFPDLSEHEIRMYLNSHSCSIERMIDSLLGGEVSVEMVKKMAINNKKSSHKVPDYKSVLKNHHSVFDGDDLDTGLVNASQLHIGKRQSRLSTTVDPELRNIIMNIMSQQQLEEENHVEMLNGNQNYDDEFDDVYGISHDNFVMDDKRIEEATVDTEMGDKRVTDNSSRPKVKGQIVSLANGATGNTGDTASTSVIMEPSARKFSQYDKNKRLKARFHDGPDRNRGVADNRYDNHRMGSHAPNPKRDNQKPGRHNFE